MQVNPRCYKNGGHFILSPEGSGVGIRYRPERAGSFRRGAVNHPTMCRQPAVPTAGPDMLISKVGGLPPTINIPPDRHKLVTSVMSN